VPRRCDSHCRRRPKIVDFDWNAQVAQSVEHVLGKDEVGGSIPLLGFAQMNVYAESKKHTAIDRQTDRRKR
jgi:hypothetical protein